MATVGSPAATSRCTWAPVQIKYDTTLRGFLTHLQANVRKMARLHGERVLAGGVSPEPSSASSLKSMDELYEQVRADLHKILDLNLVPFQSLAHSKHPWGESDEFAGKDPTRIRIGVLKKLADKARRKDPTIKFLRSWKDEEYERIRDPSYDGWS